MIYVPNIKCIYTMKKWGPTEVLRNNWGVVVRTLSFPAFHWTNDEMSNDDDLRNRVCLRAYG